MNQLQPLSPVQTLAERVTELLRERILAGDIQLGERLVETQIADQLQVSRVPVRDALRQLRNEGFVHDDPRRGSMVVKITEDDIREIYELRAALELCAVGLIMQRQDAAALQELGVSLQQIKDTAVLGSQWATVSCDYAFHEALCRLSRNQRLYRVFVSNTAVLLVLLRLESEHVHTSAEETWGDHQVLLQALQSGDLPRAEAAWDAHLGSGKSRLLNFFHQTQHGSATD